MAKFDCIFKDGAAVKKPDHPRRETKWIHYTKLVDHGAQYCNERDQEEIISLAGLIDADKEVLQNLLVRKIDADEYEIIAGHKRRRACKYLVEAEKKAQYAFLPCTVKHLSDVRAEFQLYSSNGFHEKSDYEKMHELERMKRLLETHPEEFPHLDTGRMVERLAGQLNMKKTTVGEYLTISKNLGEKGKEGFRLGQLKKSAALELSSLAKEEQEQLIDKGILAYKEIRSYKANKEAARQEGPPAGTGSERGTGMEPDPVGPKEIRQLHPAAFQKEDRKEHLILIKMTKETLDAVIHILDAYQELLQEKEGIGQRAVQIEQIKETFLGRHSGER